MIGPNNYMLDDMIEKTYPSIKKYILKKYKIDLKDNENILYLIDDLFLQKYGT